jgi:glycosyltransferase involved in cell wall biosynthesis
MKRISVCYVLSYYSPRYIRTETLIEALKSIDDIDLYQARNLSKGFVRYFQTLAKLIYIRFRHNPQYYILGFRGYEFFWIVRFITLGKILIFDHMMSPYDSLINEKANISRKGIIARIVRYYEKSILSASDTILTDTELHKAYFQELFNVPGKKIFAIPVGADENFRNVNDPALGQNHPSFFHVLFYGSFLPLHGVDVILKSAVILRDYPIKFTLIGGNRLDLTDFHQAIRDLKLANITHIDWVDFEKLAEYISRADLGLGGPFGNTGQARRVITGKTFQLLFMKKAVVIGNIDYNTGFVDKQNCLLVPQGDEKALADAILWAFEHRENLVQIGRQGYVLYQENYSVSQISQRLKAEVFAEKLLK